MSILCELSNVSRSGYYEWLKQSNKPDKDHEDYLKLKEIFDKSKSKYGWRSLKMRLPDMNHKKIQRIMRKYELITKVRKKNPYKQIMKKRMEHRIFSNKLQREFHQIVPFKVFCTDITYIPFQSRFAYLSVIKDIASGEVMAWNVSLYLEMTLVTDTIKNMQLDSCENIMIHSDQGFHYTNPTYIEVVKELKMIQSMSNKGNCIDNAPIESFFGHLKDELDYQSCQSFEELRLVIEKYMRYYNYERKQWTRNKMTPVEYR
ncbi:MAG: IS3 family transposase, partial [Patescibacteria group bacterium]